MTCTSCGDKPKGSSKGFPRAVVEINNPESLVLLRKVVIPVSMGTEEDVPPAIGKYFNVLLQYESNGHIYLYSSDGIPTAIEANIPQEVLDRIDQLEIDVDLLETGLAKETEDREKADGVLQQEIDDIKNSPDVVDIVATYSDLMAYDTSSLGDNDVIRVLRDETHDGQSAYYRWDKPHSTWTFIGTVGDYYTKQQVDTLLDGKQDELTPGENISIVDESGSLVISATDTTYTAGTGLALNGTQFSVDTTAIATQSDLTAGLANKQDTLTAGANIQINNNTISATDTTYSAFTGTDGQTAGTAGLVPAPATTDAGKFLKADGTWDTAGGGSVTPVQTTGTSTTDVMSQDAITKMVYPMIATLPDSINIRGTSGIDIATANYGIAIGASSLARGERAVSIGYGAQSYAAGDRSVAIGNFAKVNANSKGVAIGNLATCSNPYSIALGSSATTSRIGEVNIGAGTSGEGYNSTNYRVLGGVHDAVDGHDATTLNQLDGRVKQNAGAPTTATVGTVGQLLEDTTNGKLYQCTDATNPYVWEEVGSGGGGLDPNTTFWGQTASNGAVTGDLTLATDTIHGNAEITSGATLQDGVSVSLTAGGSDIITARSYTDTQSQVSISTIELGGTIDAGSNQINNLAAGTANTDAVNKSQLDAKPTITMTTTDPGEGSALAANNFVAVYGGDPIIMDYSTTEINTGTKWIDGSTIYKKTINTGTLPNNTFKRVAHNISNLYRVIRIEGYAYSSSNSRCQAMPMVSSGGIGQVSVSVDPTEMELVSDSDRSAYTESYVTLYYTKSSS